MSDSSDIVDKRYFIINGRRWRRTDPSIPPTLNKQLVNELMSARRAVKTAKSAGDDEALSIARSRVSDAKTSLGERGHPWWETPTEESLKIRLAATIRCLLRNRAEGKTICPSEAARIVGGRQWRGILEQTIKVAWEMERTGWLFVTQRGERASQPTKGPIRLQKGEPLNHCVDPE